MITFFFFSDSFAKIKFTVYYFVKCETTRGHKKGQCQISLCIFEPPLNLYLKLGSNISHFDNKKMKCHLYFSKEYFQPVFELMYNFADVNLIDQKNHVY